MASLLETVSWMVFDTSLAVTHGGKPENGNLLSRGDEISMEVSVFNLSLLKYYIHKKEFTNSCTSKRPRDWLHLSRGWYIAFWMIGAYPKLQHFYDQWSDFKGGGGWPWWWAGLEAGGRLRCMVPQVFSVSLIYFTHRCFKAFWQLQHFSTYFWLCNSHYS